MTLHNVDTQSSLVRLGTRPEDYERFGIGPLPVEQFEDGLRTDPHTKGAYEWWYFDSHLEDGAKLVVMFATKDPSHPSTGLKPFLTINLDLPDGRSLSKQLTPSASTFRASSDGCDVRIGDHSFSGDLHTYRIVAAIEEVSVDVTLTGDVPPWRPETGYALFGEEGHDEYFAWLAAVPHGPVAVTYTVDGDTVSTTGTGYHDHNWGDAPMLSLMHDWYWGRAQVGPYSLIASYVTATKKYGFGSQTSFVLARDGEVVAGDGALVTFSTAQVHTDEETGKPVADVTTYDYDDGSVRYVATFEREETIFRAEFINGLPPVTRALARLARFDGAYLRFVGTLTLRKFVDGELAEEVTEDKALWELMYFGHARRPRA